MSSLKKIILPATATALILGQTGCKDDELTVTEKLVGEWNIEEGDGDIEDWIDEWKEDDYEIHLEFHLEGDFEFSLVDNGYKYSYLGDWEWANSKKDEIKMSFDEGDAEIDLIIDTFEGDEITGYMEISYDDYLYDGDVVLERVYIDNNALHKKSVSLEDKNHSGQNNRFENFLRRNKH